MAERDYEIIIIGAGPAGLTAGLYVSRSKINVVCFERLAPGNEITGPAVIHTPITTIVLQDKQTGLLDEYRNMVINFS